MKSAPSPKPERRTCAAFGIVLAAALAGCAVTSPDAGADAGISGRLGIHVDAAGDRPASDGSAFFDLRGDDSRGVLTLTSTIGTTVAQARWEGGAASLRAGDRTREFASIDALSREALGESLPLQALFDWLRGRPWPAAASEPLDEARGFRQLGWAIDLARFREGRISLSRSGPPAASLRVLLDTP